MKEGLMHIVKEDKKKLLFLAVLMAAAVLLLLYGSGGERKELIEEEPVSADSPGFDGAAVEAALAEVLSRIDGAGEVSVVISWQDDGRKVYAYHEETTNQRREDGIAEETRKNELVLAEGGDVPVVSLRERPEAEGVLVVADGAGSDVVREKLLEAAAVYLDIGRNRVEIAAGSGE